MISAPCLAPEREGIVRRRGPERRRLMRIKNDRFDTRKAMQNPWLERASHSMVLEYENIERKIRQTHGFPGT